MRDKHEKYFEEIMAQVNWPEPSNDLRHKIITSTYSRDKDTILFFPMVKISSWVMIAFVVAFTFGMWIEEGNIIAPEQQLEAAYYGASAYDFIEKVGQ